MEDNDIIPASARDALIVELLSDVGHLHDEIKSIPKSLKLSMTDTLNIVASAVEEAERTALSLQKDTKDIIQATTAKAGFDIGVELTGAIHKSLEKVFEPALSRATEKIASLENKVTSVSGSIRDTQATRFNYIILSAFVIVAVMMIGSLSWLAIKTQDVNETNKWFYDEYKAQRKVIDRLPDAIKQQFKVQH